MSHDNLKKGFKREDNYHQLVITLGQVGRFYEASFIKLIANCETILKSYNSNLKKRLGYLNMFSESNPLCSHKLWELPLHEF